MRRLGRRNKRVLPGFGLSLGISLFFVSLVLLLPMTGLVVETSGMTWDQFWFTITDPRVVESYKVTLWTALAASLFFGERFLVIPGAKSCQNRACLQRRGYSWSI